MNVVICNYQEGDMIVCIAEKAVGIRQRPLSQVRGSNLKAFVYFLPDIRPSQSHVEEKIAPGSVAVGKEIKDLVLLDHCVLSGLIQK